MDDVIVASNNAETALVTHGAEFEKRAEESESASSSDESEEEMPPGPVDPEKCTVGGPGTTGGAAQAPVSFYIHAKDSRDARMREGGDYVVVKVVPGSTARASGAKESQAIVQDNGDGTYTATYSVEARGDYELTVEINGSAVGGSPFPVFFSPPVERQPGEPVLRDAAGVAIDSETVSAASAMPAPAISIMGSDAFAAKVEFPEGASLDRTVLVGELNPQVNLEQLQQLFSYSGQVTDVRFAGAGNKFALVEFSNSREAEQALTLDKLLVIDRQIRVEPARSAFESKGQSRVTQFAAVQLQQIAQLQRAQMEQHSLAAHVASMRVQAKQTQGAGGPGMPQNSASQKAAALSAIAALSKRLTGSSYGGSGGPAAAPEKSASPRPGKRRRDVSPTLRYRSRRSRSRSRSPRRRRSSPYRRRSPPRRRSPVIRLRSPRRRRSPPRRRRSPDRKRFSERRRSPERRRSRDPRRSAETDARSSRGEDRERDLRREDSRERRRQRRADSPGGKTTEDRSRRESQGDDGNGVAAPDGRERSLGGDHGAKENGGSKEEEAHELRQRALEAMKSLGREDAQQEGSDGAGRGEERKERKKQHKEKKHKKDKKHKRDRHDDRDTELPEIEPED